MSELPTLVSQQQGNRSQANSVLARSGFLFALALGLGLATYSLGWYTILALGPLVLVYGWLTRRHWFAIMSATLAVLIYLSGSLLALLMTQPASSINRVGVAFWAITTSGILSLITILAIPAPQLSRAPTGASAPDPGVAELARSRQGQHPQGRIARKLRVPLALLLLLSGDAWLLHNFAGRQAPTNTYLLSLQVTAPLQQLHGLTIVLPLPAIDGRPYNPAEVTTLLTAGENDSVAHHEQVVLTDQGPALAISIESLPRLLGPVVPHPSQPGPQPGVALQRLPGGAGSAGSATGTVSQSASTGNLTCPGIDGSTEVKVLDPYLPSCSLAYLGSFQESYPEVTPGAYTHPLRFSHTIPGASAGVFQFPLKVLAGENVVVEISLALTSITDTTQPTNPLVSQPLHRIQEHNDRIDIVTRRWNGWQIVTGHAQESTETTYVPFS